MTSYCWPMRSGNLHRHPLRGQGATSVWRVVEKTCWMVWYVSTNQLDELYNIIWKQYIKTSENLMILKCWEHVIPFFRYHKQLVYYCRGRNIMKFKRNVRISWSLFDIILALICELHIAQNGLWNLLTYSIQGWMPDPDWFVSTFRSTLRFYRKSSISLNFLLKSFKKHQFHSYISHILRISLSSYIQHFLRCPP